MQTRLTVLPLMFIAAASPAAPAQQLPSVRQLGTVTARTTEPLTSVSGIRALNTGSVLVNDPASRRVLLFDPMLSKFAVIADSTSATGNAYGGRFGGLVAYHADSTLFVDPMSMSMLVIDPAGKLGRVISVPRSHEAAAFVNAAFDPSGRLVYRAFPSFRMTGRQGAQPGSMPTPPEQPDSAALVRVDLSSRQLDTVAYFKIPKVNFQVTRREDGSVEMTSEINPLPIVDDWAVLPDGSIAIVRGSDYHVDFISPDGSRRSSPKLPFDWQRLTDEDKVAFIDSVKAARERLRASGAAPGTPLPPGLGGGVPIQVMTIREGGPGGRGAGGAAGPGREPQLNFVAPEQLPDYKPPFFAGSVRADTEGNLWIRTIPTKAISGGPVYDVINREGQLVERVQVAEGRTIVGFGPGVVYLTAREGTQTFLERANVR